MRPVDAQLKETLRGMTARDGLLVPDEVEIEGSSLQEVYDALFALKREGMIVEDMREDGYSGYRLR